MIRKLRIKFVVINMAIVTILLCVILGLVYQLTQAHLEAQSVEMLRQLTVSPIRSDTPITPGQDVRLPYFILRLSPSGEWLSADGGYYDLSNEAFLDQLVDEAGDSRHPLGVLSKYNLRYYRSPRGQFLAFADISSELDTLDGLMKTCTLIGVLGFCGFLTASILLSGWAVRPVDEAMKRQQKFIADASHELKTPLTVIMTNAQMLQDGPPDASFQDRASDHILKMSRQMQKLIERMLVLARADSPDQASRPEFSPVDLSRLVSDGLLPFEPLFFEQGLTLNTRIEPGLSVPGNQTQLKQVLEILLDNALKYTRPEGTVWVTLVSRGRSACQLSVADEGDPIPPDTLERLFDRFYRGDEARSRTGSFSFGLGLSIARSIADQHRAKLHAESRNGVNRFSLELKRQPVHPPRSDGADGSGNPSQDRTK